MCTYICIYIYIYIYTGWWFQPIWKILVSRDAYSQFMENKKNVPNHRPVCIYIYIHNILIYIYSYTDWSYRNTKSLAHLAKWIVHAKNSGKPMGQVPVLLPRNMMVISQPHMTHKKHVSKAFTKHVLKQKKHERWYGI